jgi:hypothetical protein
LKSRDTSESTFSLNPEFKSKKQFHEKKMLFGESAKAELEQIQKLLNMAQ